MPRSAKSSSNETVIHAKEIAKRLRALKGSKPSPPKGIPEWYPNRTDTDPLIPDKSTPPDNGFDFRNMITGSGNGPEMSSGRPSS